MERVSTGFYN
jgi:hypothetical protein